MKAMRCSPCEREVNRRGVNFLSISEFPSVDQASGPRAERTSQRREIHSKARNDGFPDHDAQMTTQKSVE